jgi:hypothetical protein
MKTRQQVEIATTAERRVTIKPLWHLRNENQIIPAVAPSQGMQFIESIASSAREVAPAEWPFD